MSAADTADGQRLAGRRIVVTRAAAQSGELSAALKAAGADVVDLALIDIVPSPDNSTVLAARLAVIDDYDWLIVTSPNGARCVRRHGGPSPRHCRLAVIGAATAAAMAPYAPVAFVPGRSNAGGLLDEFPMAAAGRALLVQGDLASPLIAEALLGSGWSVDRVIAYSTVSVTPDPSLIDRARRADAITFMSSSAVRAFIEVVGAGPMPEVAASIGPSTTATLRASGFEQVYEAAAPTVAALVEIVSTALQ